MGELKAVEAMVATVPALAEHFVTSKHAEKFMLNDLKLPAVTPEALRDFMHRLSKDVQETKAILDSMKEVALTETKAEMARRRQMADKTPIAPDPEPEPQQMQASSSKEGSTSKKKSNKKKQRDKRAAASEAADASPAKETRQPQPKEKEEEEGEESAAGQADEDAQGRATAEEPLEEDGIRSYEAQDKVKAQVEVQACPICEWEEDDDDEQTAARVVLGCGHDVFHVDCLVAWRGKCREKRLEFTCPMCRAPITQAL